MKNVIIALVFGLLLFSCEGKQGPVVPQGPAGEPGVTIIYIYGTITVPDYLGNAIYLYNSVIVDDAVTQVYISADSDVDSWTFVEDFYLEECWVRIDDPNFYYIGYDYMIMIIADNSIS